MSSPESLQYAALRKVLVTVLSAVALAIVAGVGGLLLVLRPLTGRILVHTRDLQAEVNRLQAIRRTLRARTARLARANSELAQLTRSAAHEFQEPLRSLVTHAELLKRRAGASLPPDLNDILDWIAHNARRMRDQIEGVRVYLGIGRGAPPRERVDTAAVVERVLVELGAAIRGADAEVVRGPLPVVTGHPEELHRLFRNLLDNALRYTRPDRRPRIRVEARRQDGAWSFRVSDNGIGIPPALAPKALDIFRRLHAGADAGTGMGLAICRRIVEHHGGTIAIEPAEGGGTTVAFTLPDRRGGAQSA